MSQPYALETKVLILPLPNTQLFLRFPETNRTPKPSRISVPKPGLWSLTRPGPNGEENIIETQALPIIILGLSVFRRHCLRKVFLAWLIKQHFLPSREVPMSWSSIARIWACADILKCAGPEWAGQIRINPAHSGLEDLEPDAAVASLRGVLRRKQLSFLSLSSV